MFLALSGGILIYNGYSRMGKLTIGNLEKCPIPPGGAPSPPSLGKTIICQGSMTWASNWYISDSQLRKSNFYQLTEHLGEEPTPSSEAPMRNERN